MATSISAPGPEHMLRGRRLAVAATAVTAAPRRRRDGTCAEPDHARAKNAKK